MDAVIAALVGLIDLVTRPIPLLASSGILLLLFGAIWAAILVALVRDPARLDAGWRAIRARSVPVQAVAWVLLLPVMVGLWAWHTAWPRSARLGILAALAGWNLLVLLPAAA